MISTPETGSLTGTEFGFVIYSTYFILLVSGLWLAWRFGKSYNFLSLNGTQTGLPLAANFIASSMGCGMLTTFPQIANQAGLHGLLVYSISGAMPILGFAAVGPYIRRKCPDGFVFTEWVRQRFGPATALYVSFCTCFTMFLFMLGELTALKAAVETLTGLDATGSMLIQCVITTLYTACGGFSASFVTGNVQGVLVMVLVAIAALGMSSEIHIDHKLVASSGLLQTNKLGWQLLYILPVAITTNDCFSAGFWLRTFASKSDRDLWIGCSIATAALFALNMLAGSTGLVAVWAGFMEAGDENGYNAFYVLMRHMPQWVVVAVLMFVVVVSTCTFDSMQSGMISTISNDLFRNRLRIAYVRVMVVAVMIPTVVLAVYVANDILKIYLIADLVSAAVIPAILLGLNKNFDFLLGADIIAGGLAAFVAVFVWGSYYYGSTAEGLKLLLVWNGLGDPEDWGAFGAFVICPLGSVLFALLCAGARLLHKTFSSQKGKYRLLGAGFEREDHEYGAAGP